MPSRTSIIPDQLHLNVIRDALLNRPGSGACVMVGSGFSRNAKGIHSSAALPPLWRDIIREMVKQLYTGDDSTEWTGDASSALRIAETFESNFGRTKLHDFLGLQIRDDEFIPGEAHSRLLSLPWRDVFTTNWDTLLERTNPNVGARYALIQHEQQIPQKNHPRIVKLHGSLPAQFPLIVTEEDYRTYPESHPLFVNTVRQAMVETVFCLVGFSGTDPNFREWSGWVRDHLGGAAQKIYLVGCLDLVQQDRAVLQDLNVVPIDIANHPQSSNWPKELRQQYAVEWFLHALESSTNLDEDIDWPSSSDTRSSNIPGYLLPVPGIESGETRNHPVVAVPGTPSFHGEESVDRVRSVIEDWANNRETYPGWLVLPFGRNRSDLSRRTDEWEPHILNALPEIGPVERLKAVREVLWRREILLEPITIEVESAAHNALDAIDCEHKLIDEEEKLKEDWEEIRTVWITVALALLTAARLDCNHQRFDLLLQSLSAFQEDSPEAAHRVSHERCLLALFSMDFESLNRLLDSWEVVDCDPVWMLRKAALLTELNRFDESRPLVQEALTLIQSDSEVTRKISNLSREGWTLGSMLSSSNSREIFRRWDELSSKRCHAWDELDDINRILSPNPSDLGSPAYELGISRTTTTKWSNESYHRMVTAFRAVRISEVTGLPPVNFPESDFPLGVGAATGILKLGAEELITVKPELAIKLALRVFTSEGEKGLQRIVSRFHVATLEDDVVAKLAQASMSAIDFSLPRLIVPGEPVVNQFAIAKIRVACEVLSRLVMRLPQNKLDEVLDLGMRCYRTVPIHYWLGPPTGNLLKRTWEALSKPERTERVFDMLAAPIAGLDGFIIDTMCPDPCRFLSDEDFPPSRTVDSERRLESSLDLSIRGLDGDESSRGRATYRLVLMVRSGLLREDELGTVAKAIWGGSDPILSNSSGSDAPRDWTLYVLPEIEEKQAERSFRQKWLSPERIDQTRDLTFAGNLIEQVGVAISALPDMDMSLDLSEKDERYIATQVENLAAAFCSESLSFSLYIGSQVRHLGPLVSRITFPDAIAVSLFQKAESLIDGPGYPSDAFRLNLAEIRTAIGFGLVPGLIKALPDRTDRMIDWLRVGLASDDEVRVSSAVSAVKIWISDCTLREIVAIPDDLLVMIGVIVASRRSVGVAHALSCAVKVFNEGTNEHRNAIGSLVLSGLRHSDGELKYESNRQNDDLPTLRLLCVQLAKAMSTNGYADDVIIRKWLDEGKKDPFPEVRRAAHS